MFFEYLNFYMNCWRLIVIRRLFMKHAFYVYFFITYDLHRQRSSIGCAVDTSRILSCGWECRCPYFTTNYGWVHFKGECIRALLPVIGTAIISIRHSAVYIIIVIVIRRRVFCCACFYSGGWPLVALLTRVKEHSLRHKNVWALTYTFFTVMVFCFSDIRKAL